MIQGFKSFYNWLIKVGTGLQHVILLAMRLFWGWQFFITGSGKLKNIAPIIDFFKELGIPFPWLNAHISASIETVGGLCLLIGFASRLVSVPLAFVMCIAYLTAHIAAVDHIFTEPLNFVAQLPFNFLLTALIVFAFGPGAFSVDALIKRYSGNKS